MPRKAHDAEVNDLIRAIGLLVRRVRAAAPTNGLSITESAVIARLFKEGPATNADLARAEGMKPQSMGATIAALEQQGLIKRRPHPTDGRQFHIELTAKGTDLREKERAAKHTWLGQMIEQLDAQDREALLAAGKIIQRLAEM